MATIDVGPVDLTPTPASQWGLHWDADAWGDAIVIPLAPELLVGDVLTPIAQGALALARSDATLTLTLDASVWTFGGAGYRPVAATDLPAFLDAVQAVEGSQLAVGSAAALRVMLAGRIPATYAESLLMRYGLYRASGVSYVDLVPGVRLQIDAAASQFVPASSSPPPGIGGYVLGASSVVDVVSAADGTVVVNAFLAGNTVPAVQPATGGAGAMIDVQSTVRGRHLRLCYPAQLGPSSAAGSTDVAQNVAIVGADTRAGLAAATSAYYQGTVSGPATFLRGRATLTPLLPVAVNGATSFVAAGTTARQLLERAVAIPRLAARTDATNVHLQRTVSLITQPGGAIAGRVSISPAAAVAGSALDAWDMPLFGGDGLTVDTSS